MKLATPGLNSYRNPEQAQYPHGLPASTQPSDHSGSFALPPPQRMASGSQPNHRSPAPVSGGVVIGNLSSGNHPNNGQWP